VTDLEHVGQKTEDGVEVLPLLLTGLAVGNSAHELGEEAEVEDERGRKERVLALVEHVLSHYEASEGDERK
jgi:hypothetical protein